MACAALQQQQLTITLVYSLLRVLPYAVCVLLFMQAVGLCTGQIKTGAPCRSERLAKYNQV
jgi:ABC-type uncharacterized transport system permease subunit